MKFSTALKRAFLSILFTGLPIAAHAGGGDGGGGFKYVNSQLLLRNVSHKLAKEILNMNDAAFSQFPPDMDRKKLAFIIANVVPAADSNRERTNPEGEQEGLMFDYDRNLCDASGCGPRILAREPFYDSYAATPVKTLEAMNKKPDMYTAIQHDVRERLLHELAHLLNVGVRPDGRDDSNADTFAQNFESVLQSQYVVCLNEAWQTLPQMPDKRFNAFIIQLQTGQVGYTYTWDMNSAEIDSPLKKYKNPDFWRQQILDIISATEKNLWSDGFNTQPHSNNFLSRFTPRKYVNQDGQIEITLYGDKTPDVVTTIKVNLSTGQATTSTVDASEYLRTGLKQYLNDTLSCHLAGPSMQLSSLVTP